VSEIGAILISRLDLAVPALVAVFGLWLTALSIQAQTRNSRIEKIADVLMDCTQRFHGVEALRDGLEAAVRKGDVDVEAARERYFEAYWHFQWDQWNYFKLGLIPHEIYADWFFQRIVLMRLNHKSFGVIFEEGWRQIARPQFITYVEFLPVCGRGTPAGAPFGRGCPCPAHAAHFGRLQTGALHARRLYA
jgi:hypothetical protein